MAVCSWICRKWPRLSRRWRKSASHGPRRVLSMMALSARALGDRVFQRALLLISTWAGARIVSEPGNTKVAAAESLSINVSNKRHSLAKMPVS